MEQDKKMENEKETNQVPKYIFLVLGKIWRVFFAAFKIAFGAVATVALIGIICAFVFVGKLGDYLQSDILPEALVDIEGFDLEQNSYLHYVDANGNEVVDDTHVHNDGEDHQILCEFDQLYGGGQGVYGNPIHTGVTVVYNNK